VRQHPIVTSLELAADRAGDITPLVYERLFRAHPDAAHSFSLDPSGLVKGSMLSHAISALLDLVGDRHFADGFVRAESLSHAGFNVPPDLFRTFYPIVAETLREVLGDQWSAEIAASWHAALAELSALVEPEIAPLA
jgi:hemoglobin-like flavoprotein